MASAYNNDTPNSIQNMAPTSSPQTTFTIPSTQGAGGLVGATGVVPGATGSTSDPSPLSSSSAGTATGAAGVSSTQPDPTGVAALQTEKTREALEEKLQELIQSLLELSITVYDFQAESNSLVHQKIQELTKQLGEIEQFKDQLDMMVPWEVLSYIEDGKNPDLFSKTFVEAVAGENQFTNGKVTAMKSFEAALVQNLGDAFPEDMADYNAILQEVNSKSGQGTTTGFTPIQ